MNYNFKKMKLLLEKLFQYEYLTRTETHRLMLEIASEKYNIASLASFLTVFRMRPILPEELLGFRDGLLELAKPVDFRGVDSIDIVGTGGDKKNTFNISTMSAVVVAGAGYKVTKHGSYSVSSACGSSNVLEHLGYEFTHDNDVLNRQLDDANICFLHAPVFHPAMKAVVPVRRALGVKTFFNILGPLVNPAQPKYNFLGVYDQGIGRLYQYVMQETGRIFNVIYALDGYDEISLTGKFKLFSAKGENVLDADAIGLRQVQAVDLYGGETVPEAAKIFMNILEGAGTPAQNEVVFANAGLAIHLMNPNLSVEEAIGQARESLMSGQALAGFKKITK